MYAAIWHFRWALSDHNPLTFALHRQSDAWSARLQQHLSYVAEYTLDIRHVAGKENVVSDCLSRSPEVLSLPRSTKVASVKAPFGSLAAPVAQDGSPRSSTVAVVTPGPVLDIAELARAQESCKETQELCAKLDAQDVPMYRGSYCVLIREKKKLLLEVGAAQTWLYVDRLKPHAGVGTPAVAHLPPRGCPRKT